MTATSSSPDLLRRHLLEGLAALFIYVALGIALEYFLAFKSDFYVNANWQTRRLMWRLAHAHGTLIALVHLAMVLVLKRLGDRPTARFVSYCLSGAVVLVPLGFFLGGLRVHGGDPGAGIALVPAGAFLLLLSLGFAWVALWRTSKNPL